jgi:hypothetical protein
MSCKFCSGDTTNGLRWARFSEVGGLLDLRNEVSGSAFEVCQGCMARRVDQDLIGGKADRNYWGWQNIRDLPKVRSRAKSTSTKNLGSSTLVYLVEAGGLYKIGITNNLKSRMRAIQNGNPYKVREVLSVPHHSPKALEDELHNRFALERLEGEWFSLSAQDVEECQQIMKGACYA